MSAPVRSCPLLTLAPPVRAYQTLHMDTPEAPRDDLVRAVWPGAEYRADHDDDDQDDGLGTLSGHFSVFGSWYEVNSVWEGKFLERIQAGAFSDTIANDRAEMRVLFNHGQDMATGDKPLGAITELEEDSVGCALRSRTPRHVLRPGAESRGLEAGLYGASMRFSVTADEWDDEPRKSKRNPDKLPERTITEAKVFEFGPVTFPASPSATAGVRSLSPTASGAHPWSNQSRQPRQYRGQPRRRHLWNPPPRRSLPASRRYPGCEASSRQRVARHHRPRSGRVHRSPAARGAGPVGCGHHRDRQPRG